VESRWQTRGGRASLPSRGVAAHRGGAAERPENTLAAFENAVQRGVHQVELDVRRSADGALVVMHDAEVDRTTNGRGRVCDLKLAALRRLDAGTPVHPGLPIPTLDEALAVLPRDVWINVQIKRGEAIADEVALTVLRAGRSRQVIVTGGNDACRRVRRVDPSLRVCNLARQRTRAGYLEHAAREGAAFIQFHYLRGPMEPELAARAHRAGMRVNFMCSPTPSPAELRALFDAGVDFVLVDDLAGALRAARSVGILPLDRPGLGSVSASQPVV
jgi:glycerophosphoryl diester phosphodiesterase